jgi:hypothetical protein
MVQIKILEAKVPAASGHVREVKERHRLSGKQSNELQGRFLKRRTGLQRGAEVIRQLTDDTQSLWW